MTTAAHLDRDAIEFTRNVVTGMGSDPEFRGGLHLSLRGLDPNATATLTTSQSVAMCDGLFGAHRGLLLAASRADRQPERR